MSCLCKIFFIVVTINLIQSAPVSENQENFSTTTTYDFEDTTEFKFVNDSVKNFSNLDTEESLIKDNGKESFYDLYCQAKSVVDRKLMSLEESDLNTFMKVIHLKTPVDCGKTEKAYVKRIHEKLTADIKSQEHDSSKISCIYKNVLNLDFDLMHYKHNTLVYLKRYRSDLTNEPVFKNNQFDLKAETHKKIEKSVTLCSTKNEETPIKAQITTESVLQNTEVTIDVTEQVIRNTERTIETTEQTFKTTERSALMTTKKTMATEETITTKEKDALETPEVFCQVKTVIDKKLLDFEGSDLAEKISWPQLDVDCKKRLEIFSEKFHKLLRKKFLDKRFDLSTFECIYDNVVIRGYETLRYKTNAIKYFLQNLPSIASDEDKKILNTNLDEINSQKTSIVKTSYDLCTVDDNDE